MSTVTITQLYELFVPKLGKEAAEGLATYLETKPKIELENNLKHLATKEDLTKLEVGLTRLEGGLAKIEGGLIGKIEGGLAKVEHGLIGKIEGGLAKVEHGLIGKIEGGLAKVEGGLMSRIEKSKAETIKWMFIFWIGQVLAICGFMLLFIKK